MFIIEAYNTMHINNHYNVSKKKKKSILYEY